MFTFNNNKSGFKYFPFFQQHYWKTPGGQLSFISTNSTITPALTVSGGPAPVWHVTESTGITYRYEAASFSHTKTGGTGNLTVRLVNTEAVKSYVTQIDFNGDGIVSSFFDLHIEKFSALEQLKLYLNSLTGNLSSVAWASGLTYIRINNNNFTGDLSATVWPTGLTVLRVDGNNFTGNLSSVAWPSNLTDLQLKENNFTGDLSSVVWPSGLIILYLYDNNFTGDLSGSNWPANLTYFQAQFNNFTGYMVPPVGSSPLQTYSIRSNGASQAAIDAVALAFYNNRAYFTYATPLADIDGANATPSGIYQDATPPTTGLEYIFKLENDPDLEGFNKWNITYTA